MHHIVTVTIKVIVLRHVGLWMQLVKVYSFNQRQQATLQSSDGEVRPQHWETEPLVGIAADGHREHGTLIPTSPDDKGRLE